VRADLDLYLAPRQFPGDAAGLVLIADVEGRRRTAVGRIVRLDPGVFRKYGIQVTVDPLQSAFKRPLGEKAHLDRLSLHIGAERTVDGRRRDLIRNPSGCPASWPWQAWLIHPAGDASAYYGGIECFLVATPSGRAAA
jgi:hypothetical protein